MPELTSGELYLFSSFFMDVNIWSYLYLVFVLLWRFVVLGGKAAAVLETTGIGGYAFRPSPGKWGRNGSSDYT